MTQVTPTADSPVFYAILGEPIPKNTQLLRTAEEYRHFRTIYSAQKQLNLVFAESSPKTEVRLIMIDRTSDIPRKLWDLSHATCVIIFGPNFPWLSEATIRLWASSGRDRYVVVCHDKKNALFSWERLEEMSLHLNVRGYPSSADPETTREFWANFYNQDLRPLIQRKAGLSESELAAFDNLLSGEEVSEVLAHDHAAMDMLPGFPHVCRKAIQAIDADKSHTVVAKIVEPDGALQASIIRTSNLARYGARQRIETLPNALAMIGMQETRKILTSKAMGELSRKVDQAGFVTKDFFAHSVSVGYMAQILSLNLDEPSPKDREIIKSLDLPPFIVDTLKRFKYWSLFDLDPEFDSFTAGILHDVGKILNTVCYKDTYPLILYEIERSKWQDRLLDCETAVVGDLQHPVTSGALLKRWEVFPKLIDAIRDHHRIEEFSLPETVLIALANCLVKGMYPFPRLISIPEEYRSTHLYPASDQYPLNNPLPGLLRKHLAVFEREENELALDQHELDSGEYSAASLEAFIEAARTAAHSSSGYSEGLLSQSPEILDIVEWTKVPMDDWLAFSILMRNTIVEMVNRLAQSTN